MKKKWGKQFTSVEEVNWLHLPHQVLFFIADKYLNRQKDLIRFGAVCQTWQSIYTDIRRHRSPRSLPLLMVATDLNRNNKQTRSLYSLTGKTVCNPQVQVPQDRYCPGSSHHGWVVTVSPSSQVSLLNPFLTSDNEIHLPPLTAFEHEEFFRDYFHPGFLHKAILSANPASEPNYVVLAIYNANRYLAFFKTSSEYTWCSLDSKFWWIEDAIYYRDQFYIVDSKGEVFAFDLSQPDPMVSRVAPPHYKWSHSCRRYLGESSSGGLLQILRYFKWNDPGPDGLLSYYVSSGFNVYMLDPITLKWIELGDLDGQILFMGDNFYLCLQGSDFPECKSNAIYFTDDDDMGVFSFEDWTIETHYQTKSGMMYPPPIWIEPPI